MDFPPIVEQERSPFLVRRKAVESKESRSIHKFIETTGSIEAWDDTSESKDGNKSSTTVSDWGVGWQTPSIIGGAFTLGILNPAASIAVAHVSFFYHMDGKMADGPDQVAPQSYVLTASNILANVFALSLNIALAYAFCQHLWWILRRSHLKISTIEVLFSLRSNPLLLRHGEAIVAAPLLFLIAVLMWAVHIAVSFPPGALTIIAADRTTYSLVQVPSFDNSKMGNGSGLDVGKYFVAPDDLFLSLMYAFPVSGNQSRTLSQTMSQLATQVLISGEPVTLPSPCGVNCSYTINFEGPYFECNSTEDVVYLNSEDFIAPGGNLPSIDGSIAYIANYETPSGVKATTPLFNISTYLPIAANNNTEKLYSYPATGYSFIATHRTNLICAQWRANYTLTSTYANNIRTTRTSLGKLGLIILPEFIYVEGIASYSEPGNWTTEAVRWYRDANLMGITRGAIGSMLGNYTAFVTMSGLLNETTPLHFNGESIEVPPSKGGKTLWSYDVKWVDHFISQGFGSVGNARGASEGLLIGASRFSSNFDTYSNYVPDPPKLFFTVAQDSLNSFLLNYTISIMSTFNLWPTESNATVRTTVNIFSLSRPLNIFIPYFLCLGLAIPFLVLGLLALKRNGVNATDGGFLQILTTTTGGESLRKAAAGGCLGGAENVPRELKELKIRFGELVEEARTDEGLQVWPARAGFGIESEVVSLEKGRVYGIEAGGSSEQRK